MSVAAFVISPKELNDDGGMYTPVATEKCFYDDWFPIIEKLELKWLTHISFGLDVTNENLQEVLNELNVLTTWIQKPENVYYTWMLERINNLNKMLNKAFEHKNVEIFIG